MKKIIIFNIFSSFLNTFVNPCGDAHFFFLSHFCSLEKYLPSYFAHPTGLLLGEILNVLSKFKCDLDTFYLFFLNLKIKNNNKIYIKYKMFLKFILNK